MTKKFNGFTLAEVLITLGIIGVVAAMTMPTLINQTNGAQYKAAYKKALSAISQGVTLNVALDDLSFADVDNDKVKLYEDILQPRMNIVKKESKAQNYTINSAANGVSNGDGNTTLYFNDGSMFQYNAGNAKNCSKDTNIMATYNKTNCSGFIDVNGAKGPNKVVVCDNGTGTGEAKACEVKSPTDIYPVQIYDQTIVPSSEVASAVLYGK